MKNKLFVGMDVHKESIAIALAEEGLEREVRFYGNTLNKSETINKLAKKFAKKIF